jgi:hypothetical protein
MSTQLDTTDKAASFKEYVHKRLDDFKVPHDPDPEHNAQHGCRIEGRLNFVFDRLTKAMALLERAAGAFERETPDAEWFGELYELTGEHMLRTEEGWQPGTEKQTCIDEEIEILEEVNAPESSK